MAEIIFKNNQDYIESLETLGAISKLFTEKDIPYYQYRTIEKTFCKEFSAKDISRSDSAFDAIKNLDGINYGVGLKTFTASVNKDGKSSYSFEKIAEFNRESKNFLNLSIKDLVIKIAELRNTRIKTAKLEYGVDKSIYHCVVRYDGVNDSIGKVIVREYSYELIDLENIVITDKNYKSLIEEKLLDISNEDLFFMEGNEFYKFTKSKSTLYKRFDTSFKSNDVVIEVVPFEDPMDVLKTINTKRKINKEEKEKKIINECIYLPLFIVNRSSFAKMVPERSGLNQWNAKGRKRKFGEMYIPVPVIIHKKCPMFLPSKNTIFNFVTPTGKKIKSSLCQGELGKALMSVKNTELSEWFHPLLLGYGVEAVVTYDDLLKIGKDSIKIEKLSENEYEFSLAPIGSWEEFQNNLANKIDTELLVNY